MDAANRQLLNLTEVEYERFRNLGEEIKTRLKEAVMEGRTRRVNAENGLSYFIKNGWERHGNSIRKKYMWQSGICISAMSDSKLYYDKEVAGCAEFLEAAIRFWVNEV